MTGSGPTGAENHVLGVVQDPRTDTLATDLRSAGFQEFTVLHEEDVRQGAGIETAGPAGQVIQEIKNSLGDGVTSVEPYEDAVRSGRPIVAVRVGSEAQAEQAGDVLQRNHVQQIRYFTKEAVRDLPTDNH